MGWIKREGIGELVGITTDAVFRWDDGKIEVVMGCGEDYYKFVLFDGRPEDAETEFDCIASWLNDGAQGVYAVGEGPRGAKADVRYLDGLCVARSALVEHADSWSDTDGYMRTLA